LRRFYDINRPERYYLYPRRWFMPIDFEDPCGSTEVIGRIPASAHEVLVTRNGGLFV